MSNISAADVKKLRDLTGAGMMDCKKALTEAEGDYDKAVEILRLKGQKLLAKREDREATEGVVIALTSDDQSKGVIVKLSCETDFVSKNEEFIKLTKSLAELALSEFPESLDDLLSLPYSNGKTVKDKVVEQAGVIGEKVELVQYERMEAPMIASYIHMGNRAGVLVGLNKSNDDFMAPGRDVAMQVAAMKPIALDQGDVDEATIQSELNIGMELARNEGKPEAMLEKIARGRLNKFFKESTLLNQQFVKDSKKSVADYLKDVDSELTVTAFKHVALG